MSVISRGYRTALVSRSFMKLVTWYPLVPGQVGMVECKNSQNKLQMHLLCQQEPTFRLHSYCNFSYVLPGVFADVALEKFFGQARQCSGGNFHIDAVDIKAAAETKNLDALLKYDSTPQESDYVTCNSNICIDDDSLDIADTEELITSNDTIKHKIVFLAGYLEHKFRSCLSVVENEDGYDDAID